MKVNYKAIKVDQVVETTKSQKSKEEKEENEEGKEKEKGVERDKLKEKVEHSASSLENTWERGELF